jgi:hypothetical protein
VAQGVGPVFKLQYCKTKQNKQTKLTTQGLQTETQIREREVLQMNEVGWIDRPLI